MTGDNIYNPNTMFYFILLSFIYCANGAKEFPTFSMDPQDIFLPYTYLANGKAPDMCRSVSSRADYVKILLGEGVTCRGKWCNPSGEENGFKFVSRDMSYEREHIIDNEYSKTSGVCDLNILANVVMAYGSWNNAVGQIPWKCVREEKRRVYGDLFKQAVENVLKCNPGCTFSDDTMEFLRNENINYGDASVGVLISAIFLIIAAISVTAYATYRLAGPKAETQYDGL